MHEEGDFIMNAHFSRQQNMLFRRRKKRRQKQDQDRISDAKNAKNISQS